MHFVFWAAENGMIQAPSILSSLPFTVLLLAIALLPLFHGTHHWWEKNRNKLLISLALGLITLLYYWLRESGYHHDDHVSPPGFSTVLTVLRHVVLTDYLPFMVMLLSLFTITSGIRWEVGMRPTPLVNTTLLLVGTFLASFIGTTGASMLLIRPVLAVNASRQYKLHTVLFFIFLVSNIGGALLPLGDPPLLLGYLRGVPFLWTLILLPHWLACAGMVLTIYFIWDWLAFRREGPLPAPVGKRFAVQGRLNYLWLAGVVLCFALLLPGKPLSGTAWIVPPYFREGMLLFLTGLSWVTSRAEVRKKNEFSFQPLGELASLFIGIFICMMPPLEILQVRGAELGLTQPWQFFWITGVLSSFLDNAPTYLVFFETATALQPGVALPPDPLLIAISLGAVFMGANTYIGNGPNFMVKSIAESHGIRMPSFFGYLLYSLVVLIPVFVLLTLIFFR
jgi:Na+/H+ antiporter NhaD/arsenite permease-like protein